MASDPQKAAGSAKGSGKGAAKGGSNAKQLAAQARAEAEAAERRRERTVRIVGGIVVLVVVAGLLTVGFLAGRGDNADPTAQPAPSADATAPLPTGVQSDTFGFPYGTGWTAANAAKLPTLEIWEDFQCPACKQVEEAAGADIQALANDGKVKLLYRPTTFLDANPNLAIANSSARATAAWGCAIDAGKGGEYHTRLFANQPTEGEGFSDELLTAVAVEAGIEGDALTTFSTCFQDGRYLPWSANSYQAFQDAGVGGTPTGYLNGVELNSAALADIEGLTAKIAGATAP